MIWTPGNSRQDMSAYACAYVPVSLRVAVSWWSLSLEHGGPCNVTIAIERSCSMIGLYLKVMASQNIELIKDHKVIERCWFVRALDILCIWHNGTCRQECELWSLSTVGHKNFTGVQSGAFLEKRFCFWVSCTEYIFCYGFCVLFSLVWIRCVMSLYVSPAAGSLSGEYKMAVVLTNLRSLHETYYSYTKGSPSDCDFTQVPAAFFHLDGVKGGD